MQGSFALLRMTAHWDDRADRFQREFWAQL
jgi:hypothetical protein